MEQSKRPGGSGPAPLPALRLRFFGAFEASRGDNPLPATRSRKEVWLLALLALRGGEPVDRSWLAGTLWPEASEEQALAYLRRSLYDLRRALGPDAPRLSSPASGTVRLDLSGADVDLLEFDRLIQRGGTSSLRQAVALHQGPLLEGCTEDWVLQDREARQQAYLNALDQLAVHAAIQGETAAAIGYLRQALAVDSLRESLHCRLMETLAAAGDDAAVLQVYRDLRVLLHRELNSAPGPATTTLYERLRNQAAQRAALPTGTVTFLLTDIEGSTRLWEEHPEQMETAIARHDDMAAALIAQHDGTLLKRRGEGDSLFAVFARASRALAAAGALQRAFLEEAWPAETPLAVRMALYTGEAALRSGDYFGTAVNRGARLRAAAHGGQVLLSGATQEEGVASLPEGASLKDLGSHRLRGLARPEPIFQLLLPGLPADFAPLRSLDALQNNLPAPVTSFVGRQAELAELKRLLDPAASSAPGTRLLTLTGPGGTGKTRLMLEAAAELAPEYEDGVWLVELASLSSPALVPQAVAAVLGLKEEPGQPLIRSLVEALTPKRPLLLLDNCEHLLAACAELADTLLRHCPKAQILATSREALGIAGEQTYPVPALSLPDVKQLPPLDALTENEAVKLFVDRARLSQPRFCLTVRNAPAVAEICCRLDGTPLAIELAAARVGSLTPEELNARLDDRFRLLTRGSRTALPRQQTLRATIDWSYDLLDDEEKSLLRRLSVFAGGWTLDAISDLGFRVSDPGDSRSAMREGRSGSTAPDMVDLLLRLVDKSLVIGEEDQHGASRYRLLETIREYAWDRLLERGEAGEVQDRHLDFYFRLAEEPGPLSSGALYEAWLSRREREHDNLRAALEWCIQGRRDAARALRLAASLWRFWWLRGHVAEGRQWMDRVLEVAGASGESPELALALYRAGELSSMQNDLATARVFYDRALAMSRSLSDRRGVAAVLRGYGYLAFHERDLETARVRFAESLELLREEPAARCALLQDLANVARREQDSNRARELYLQSLEVPDGASNEHLLAHGLQNLARLDVAERDFDQARSRYRASLELFRRMEDRQGIAFVLEGFAGLALAEDQPGRAARLFGAAESVRAEIGMPVPPDDGEEIAGALVRARAALGEEAAAAVSDEGRSLTLEQAVEYALAAEEQAR